MKFNQPFEKLRLLLKNAWENEVEKPQTKGLIEIERLNRRIEWKIKETWQTFASFWGRVLTRLH